MEKDEILPAQMETERVSIESVMNSRFFEWGFEDVRAARPPAFEVPPRSPRRQCAR